MKIQEIIGKKVIVKKVSRDWKDWAPSWLKKGTIGVIAAILNERPFEQKNTDKGIELLWRRELEVEQLAEEGVYYVFFSQEDNPEIPPDIPKIKRLIPIPTNCLIFESLSKKRLGWRHFPVGFKKIRIKKIKKE